MERSLNHETIVVKLQNGEKFGLFDDGNKCFFQDGSRVSYELLWKAIRIVNGIGEGKPCKTLPQECPTTFVGVHRHKNTRHDWRHVYEKAEV